VNKIR